MDMEKMQAYWAEQNEARRKATLENLKTTTAALQKLGVGLVRMTYSGGGDSGDYHYPIYTVGGEELEGRSGYGDSSYQLEFSGEFSSEVVVSMRREQPSTAPYLRVARRWGCARPCPTFCKERSRTGTEAGRTTMAQKGRSPST